MSDFFEMETFEVRMENGKEVYYLYDEDKKLIGKITIEPDEQGIIIDHDDYDVSRKRRDYYD